MNSLCNAKRTNKQVYNKRINDIIYTYEMICKRKKENRKKGKKDPRFAHAQAVAKKRMQK